jgi:hypothetical protein
MNNDIEKIINSYITNNENKNKFFDIIDKLSKSYGYPNNWIYEEFLNEDSLKFFINMINNINCSNDEIKICSIINESCSSYIEYKKLIVILSENFKNNNFECFNGQEQIIYKYTRNIYDNVKNTSNTLQYISNESFYTDKTCEDHKNVPQHSCAIIINEFLLEGVFYNYHSFLEFYYELTLVNRLTSEENNRIKVSKNNVLYAITTGKGLEEHLNNLYKDNNVLLRGKRGRCVENKITFGYKLKGDKNNRNQTWISYCKNSDTYVSPFVNYKLTPDKKYIENVKKEVINQLNNHSK